MVLLLDNEKQKELCIKIEKYVQKWNTRYLDAVVAIAESEDIPVESMSKVLSKPIIEKIQQEGQDLNFLPKTSKLPI
jgi:TorA maturation chaperone TorD